VWYMPLDANQGKVTGERKRITQDAALDLRPSISRDGKKLVFASNRTGNFDIWLRDLDTGKETNLTSTPADELDPAISADGTTVSFYSRGAPGKVPTFVVPASGGVAEKIYEGRFSNWSISASGSTVLGHGGRAIDTGSREVVEIVKDPKFQVLSPSFSPDDRWIAVHVRNAELTRRLYVLPYRKGQATPESEWIPVSDGKELDRDPAWSPNGNLLYFNSERDGARCIWAQRLEPATKHPASTAFPVAHFHDARISLQLIDNSGLAGPAVGEGKLVFVLGERTGNIWMTRVK
jgi:Tol biopolymer transport system component